MREFQINSAEEGQKLIRFLNRILKNAGSGFLYKMLRKKNIVLNGKKATGKESLKAGDSVKVYFSEETYRKMSGEAEVNEESEAEAYPPAPFQLQILWENRDLICVNKPAGVLSQKEDPKKPSMNEYLIRYLLNQGQLTEDTLKAFHPSVINRLDRNTSGILLFGKTMRGLQTGGELLKQHGGQKTYHCIVTGDTKRFQKEQTVTGWLWKDHKENVVQYSRNETPGSLPMEERVQLLKRSGELSLLSVVLLTGRSHQIRSSLSALGCPVLNDRKYHGMRDTEALPPGRHSLRRGQYLHAYSICLPADTDGAADGDAQEGTKTIIAPDPEEFRQIMEQ